MSFYEYCWIMGQALVICAGFVLAAEILGDEKGPNDYNDNVKERPL